MAGRSVRGPAGRSGRDRRGQLVTDGPIPPNGVSVRIGAGSQAVLVVDRSGWRRPAFLIAAASVYSDIALARRVGRRGYRHCLGRMTVQCRGVVGMTAETVAAHGRFEK